MFQCTKTSIIKYKQHFMESQSYLHANSKHPRSLKESIPYSQALHTKRISSTNSKFQAHINTIKDLEAVVRRFSVKKLFLEMTQPCNFNTEETLAQVFSCEFCKISKTPFRTPLMATSEDQFVKGEYKKTLIENQIEKAVNLTEQFFLLHKIKIKENHAFYYQSRITRHFQT